MHRLKTFLLILAVLSFFSCKKSTEEFETTAISEYSPLVIGKYITYRLDSTVFYTNFGTTTEVFTYQVKHLVDAAITDNIGRPAYRIIRYIRKNLTDNWVPDNTFMAINTGKSLEFIENNQRFLKLQQPIVNSFSWKGNTYIDTYSPNSNVRYLDGWDYTYDSVGTPLQIGSYNFENTLKVSQRDEIIGNPADPAFYSEINYGSENYAKGLGLVYRRFLHVEYQPPTSGPGYKVGYGVTYSIIDHN